MFSIRIWGKKLGLVLAGMVAACGLWACSPPEVPPYEDERQTYVAPPSLENRPFTVATKFLELIKEERFEDAYSFLGPQARRKVTKRTFANRLGDYFETANTKSSYMGRIVSNEQVSGDTAIVTLEDTLSPDSPDWVWEFEKRHGTWLLQSLDLPPLFIYDNPRQDRWH